MKIHRSIERICLTLGFMGLAVVGLAYADSWLGVSRASAAFKQPPSTASPLADAPLALLAIDRLEMEVPVFLGTNRLTLNRGAGIVEGTSLPGESGNIVISAHRDSFFRPLEHIAVGDEIELVLRNGAQRFRVVETFITDPLDVSVLETSEDPVLTLVTCYPFRYVGFAPERLIVRAVPAGIIETTPAENSVANSQ